MKTKLMALEVLKNSRKELHACQAVIHLAGGFDPEYVRGAQAAMKNMDEAIAALEADIAKPGEPYGWQVQGLRDTFKGEHAEKDAKSEAARIGGTAYAFPIYTTPQEPAAAGWMPIETAPKDGSRVLLYFQLFGGSNHQEFGCWDSQPYNKKPNPFWSGDMGRSYGVSWYRKYQPTHWMPLPAAPGGAA